MDQSTSLRDAVKKSIKAAVRVGPLPKGSWAHTCISNGGTIVLNMGESKTAADAALSTIAAHYGFDTVEALEAALCAHAAATATATATPAGTPTMQGTP